VFPSEQGIGENSFELEGLAPSWDAVYERFVEMFDLDLATSDIVETDISGGAIRPHFSAVWCGQVLEGIVARFPSGVKIVAEIEDIVNLDGNRKRYQVIYRQA
jgi:hypothetical protein